MNGIDNSTVINMGDNISETSGIIIPIVFVAIISAFIYMAFANHVALGNEFYSYGYLEKSFIHSSKQMKVTICLLVIGFLSISGLHLCYHTELIDDYMPYMIHKIKLYELFILLAFVIYLIMELFICFRMAYEFKGDKYTKDRKVGGLRDFFHYSYIVFILDIPLILYAITLEDKQVAEYIYSIAVSASASILYHFITYERVSGNY